MKPTKNTILLTGIGRRRAEAFEALGNKVIIAGRRQEVLDQTTDTDPGMASVTLKPGITGSPMRACRSETSLA